jgi:acid stress-induced BolA-like protein IbaG/YrbA
MQRWGGLGYYSPPILSPIPQFLPKLPVSAWSCHSEFMDAQTVRSLIEKGMPGARVDVRGDDGVHFDATVVSEAFNGKLPLARHRMVYATLGELMGGAIHALALKTLTPEEASQSG